MSASLTEAAAALQNSWLPAHRRQYILERRAVWPTATPDEMSCGCFLVCAFGLRMRCPPRLELASIATNRPRGELAELPSVEALGISVIHIMRASKRKELWCVGQSDFGPYEAAALAWLYRPPPIVPELFQPSEGNAYFASRGRLGLGGLDLADSSFLIPTNSDVPQR